MLKNPEGQQVPKVTFAVRRNSTWAELSTDEIFKGKTVVVFSLPGAFTPTCSSSHMPRYNELAGIFAKNGVDDIICISVNDAFVMNAWQEDQSCFKIKMIPDGNGEFTEGMGMLVSKEKVGLGKRSRRYSMLVKDGLIEKMFVESDDAGDPKVSDADTMLKYINSEAVTPDFVTLFTKHGCPHCARAKKLLEEKGYAYEEIPLAGNISSRSVRAVTNRSTVPQIFIGGKHIGGADDLEAYFKV